MLRGPHALIATILMHKTSYQVKCMRIVAFGYDTILMQNSMRIDRGRYMHAPHAFARHCPHALVQPSSRINDALLMLFRVCPHASLHREQTKNHVSSCYFLCILMLCKQLSSWLQPPVLMLQYLLSSCFNTTILML